MTDSTAHPPLATFHRMAGGACLWEEFLSLYDSAPDEHKKLCWTGFALAAKEAFFRNGDPRPVRRLVHGLLEHKEFSDVLFMIREYLKRYPDGPDAAELAVLLVDVLERAPLNWFDEHVRSNALEFGFVADIESIFAEGNGAARDADELMTFLAARLRELEIPEPDDSATRSFGRRWLLTPLFTSESGAFAGPELSSTREAKKVIDVSSITGVIQYGTRLVGVAVVVTWDQMVPAEFMLGAKRPDITFWLRLPGGDELGGWGELKGRGLLARAGADNQVYTDMYFHALLERFSGPGGRRRREWFMQEGDCVPVCIADDARFEIGLVIADPPGTTRAVDAWPEVHMCEITTATTARESLPLALTWALFLRERTIALGRRPPYPDAPVPYSKHVKGESVVEFRGELIVKAVRLRCPEMAEAHLAVIHELMERPVRQLPQYTKVGPTQVVMRSDGGRWEEPDPAEILEALRCVCFAVMTLHRLGIAHGDLRPLNIVRYCDGTGRVRFRVVDLEGCKPSTRKTRDADRAGILCYFLPIIGRWDQIPAGDRGRVAQIVFVLWRMQDAFFTGSPTREWFTTLVGRDD